MRRTIHRSMGLLGLLMLSPVAALLPSTSPAGASLPSTLTFASGSVLDVKIGILTVTVELATGVDGSDPRGSIAVTVTGSHFASSTPFGAPGSSGTTLTEFPTGTIVGTVTGSSIVNVRFTTATGSAPEVKFVTTTTGIQNCVIHDAYSEVFRGSAGALSATTTASTYRTHAYAGNATGETCSQTLTTYLDTYSAKAKISGSVSVS